MIRLSGVAALFVMAVSAQGQISPGPLSRAHQQLEGVSHCSSCHDFGAGSRGFRCLECHTEIRAGLDARAGFHAHEGKGAPGEADCSRCHMEHNGVSFELVRLDRKTFDHGVETGLALQGKHRQLKCESCHNGAKAAASKLAIRINDRNRTFLGLNRQCTSCHADRHNGQFGADCTKCHSQDAWKPAPGFNHSQTSFVLTGRHERVLCQECHKKGVSEVKLGTDCASCHADPHRGGFRDAGMRGSCETCHNTGGWKNPKVSAGFDHSKTRFQLLGRHSQVACQSCHKSSDFSRPVRHEQCANCHEDPHRGQFANRAQGSDCASCHDERSFKPTLFNSAMHQKSAFPLEGSHALLKCAECHRPAGRDTVYRTDKLTCSDCHNDAHNGEFAAEPWSNRCNLCHTTASFRNTSYSLLRHAQNRFPLSARHAAVACEECHKPAMAPLPSVAAKLTGMRPQPTFHFPEIACRTCHTDPHGTPLTCETCHQSEAWKSTLPFDHSKTHFRLEARHQNVRCADCHTPPGRPGTVVSRLAPVFAKTPGNCSACHRATDPHGGQFMTAAKTEECSACHTVAGWKATSFEHDKARFALDIAHRNVACAKCHKPSAAGFPKYRDTAKDCVTCH